MQADELIQDGDERRNERTLGFEVAVPAAPVDRGSNGKNGSS